MSNKYSTGTYISTTLIPTIINASLYILLMHTHIQKDIVLYGKVCYALYLCLEQLCYFQKNYHKQESFSRVKFNDIPMVKILQKYFRGAR